MADLNVVAIEDYSDLGQPVFFIYKGTKYSIVPISPKKARKLIRMGREIASKSNAYAKEMELLEQEGKEIPSEMFDKGDELFNFQADFISEVLAKYAIDPETQKEIVVSTTKEQLMEDIEENWTTALVNKVFKRSNEILLGEQEKK